MAAAATATTKANTQKGISTAVFLTTMQQERINSLLQYDITKFPFSDMRARFFLLDLAYFMEKDPNPTKNPNAPQIITELYQDLELPVLQPNVDAAHAYLADIFTSGTPMFAVAGQEVGQPQQDAAAQLESVIYENSTASGWKRNVNKFLLDNVKYNFGGIDINWRARRTFKATTDFNKNLFEGNREEVVRAGNELKHCDMYNTFFDVQVNPGDVCKEGEFAGTIERYSFTKMWQLVADLKAKGNQLMNVQGDDFWKSTPRMLRYYIPQVLNSGVINGGTDWTTFLTGNVYGFLSNVVPEFEVITYYRRLVPNLNGITNVADAGNVQIWKFIQANGFLILAERQTNAHDMLPIVIGQGKEDGLGLQTKGVGEILLPFQNLSGALWRARVASLARSISDRALYDPTAINKKDINSVLPHAKIPVRPQGYGKGISDYFHAIPYNDQSGQIISQEIGTVDRMASSASHINKSQQGQFTKGNRTLSEYQDVQANAYNTQKLSAIVLEDVAFGPIKRQVLCNILQYQDLAEYSNPTDGKPVTVNPVSLRQATLAFKIADGLEPKDRLLNTDVLMQTFQVLSGIQGANQEYDLLGMFTYAMGSKAPQLSKFKRQQQFVPQAPQAQGQPQAGQVPQAAQPPVAQAGQQK